MGLAGASYMTSVNILAMGPKKAREVLLLGETMNGTEAARIGLVNKAVPASELEAAGEDWAERIVGCRVMRSRSARPPRISRSIRSA